MKITEIRAYQCDLPLHEGSYTWADGKQVTVFDSTIVAITTDEGVTGYGEVCPLGPSYLPAYAAGARAGIQELAPNLIGADPTEIDKINQTMGRAMRGHNYVKSALDVACWDILGQVASLPICTLLGGRFGARLGLYRAISQDSPAVMAEHVAGYGEAGYHAFQLKVGGNPQDDIERIRACYNVLQPGQTLIADANTGWLVHEALRVLAGVSDLDIYIEQPCATYEECCAVRRRSSKPMVLDESIDGINALLRAINDRAADVVNIKISKVGGLTKARQLRDVCVAQGIALTIEDSWGGDIATTTITHLAHSTPAELRFTTTDFNSYVTRETTKDAPRRENGFIAAPQRPGLGICVDEAELGTPAVCVTGTTGT